jgi:hypothetical protein
MFHTTPRSRLFLLVILGSAFMGLTIPREAKAQVANYLGNVNPGNFTPTQNIVYFAVTVKGLMNTSNGTNAFNTAVGAMRGRTWDGHRVDVVTSNSPGVPEFVLLGWYNYTANEGGWLAIVNDSPTTSLWIVNGGATGNNSGWFDTYWITAGFTIHARTADNDHGAIAAGMDPPH